MIVLHAGKIDDRLLLWGEAPAQPEVPPPKRRGRKLKVPNPDRLPFDAGTEGLGAVLKQAGVEPGAAGRPVEAFVWLPTAQGRPAASSPLIAEPPDPGRDAVLAPWTVTALGLSRAQAVELLCACAGRRALAHGVIVGADLAFWATALRFAGALVARQQFLPDLVEQDGSYWARWRPVFSGPDTDRLSALVRAMPHACRALTSATTAPPAAPPSCLLFDFIAGVVDHLVRGPVSVGPAPSRRPLRKQVSAFASLHDQWLSALRSPDGEMEGGDAEALAQMTAQVREWERPITAATATPFRLCFRLEEPEGDEEGDAWYVRYLLQADDDPSLLIPAKDAWNLRGRRASLLRREGVRAQEYLLLSLGQASWICPRVEASLKTSAPGGYALDADGAYEFLTDKAQSLEQAGFGVMLPAWWTRRGTKLRLTARASVKTPAMSAGGGLSLDQVVQVDWEIALGGKRLSLAELRALARLKSPLVRVRGQWVQMSAEEIQTAIDFWRHKAAGRVPAREIVRMALGANTRTPVGIDFEGVRATGWVGDLLAQLDGRAAFEEFPPPAGFRGRLRPYQVRGYSWLGFLRRWGLGACLADDMGLGKTLQALALIQRDWESNERRPTLVVCPTSVVGNWQKEAARFTPDLPVLVHHGVGRAKGASFQKEAEKQAIVISSYALLHRDLDALKEVGWSGVILDEAQNIKNPETKQARAARALRADYRVVLTGTPVENHVGDLWSLTEFLNPGLLGSRAEFKRTFFIPIQAGRDPEAMQRLKRLTGPIILRRLKTDRTIIADLPDKLEMKVFCTLTREQASLYAAVTEEAVRALEEAEGIQRRGVVLATLSKLKQVCNHPAQFLGDNSPIPGRSGKLARLTEMLEEVLGEGDRALVFSQFAEMGEILRRHLQETFGQEALFLHGAVPKRQRDRMVERFQADGDGPRIFLLSLKAGGTGLNLTRASHVFHFDRWWNPAVEDQATDRAFRIGQTRNVQVHKFLCAGTFEEKIDEMIERKKEVAEKVVGTGEGWLTELSTAELKDLFALRREAIGDE